MTISVDQARLDGDPPIAHAALLNLGAGPAVAATATIPEIDAAARALLTRLMDLPAESPDRPRLRARLVELHLPLARHLARRFRDRGEQLDDLIQVANLGLIKAVDGFDASHGAAFASYAIPTILGELKRHFRDKGWHVRVPRRLQELRLGIGTASGELTQTLGRSPTVADLAARLQVSADEVIEAMECGYAYRATSLDAPVPGDGSDVPLGDALGDLDPAIERVENRVALRPLIATLPEREQRIIVMRFFGNMTQAQIAVELGISQMHVSRLLSRAVAALRERL